ncbi:metallophosphoesterase [Halorubrum vacuolatum]|uniref:Putative phosphoesterase n=1 Tax=Halorubrum vacuolatum TaxID=63740 RepID=A0A238UNZ8_HALVU|nr:metallophosphoesterase [Halorubrum vacuolatum]SNR23029.1 putative phosphoesterase [Halorubrum vacuolatum]
MTGDDSGRTPSLPDGIRFHDRAVFIEHAETLVIADTHVGRDAGSGVTLPLGERSDLRERLGRHLSRFQPTRVVIAGDVVHPFDGGSEGIQETVEALINDCREAGARPILVAGNHDVALASVWDGPIHDEYVIGAADDGEKGRDGDNEERDGNGEGRDGDNEERDGNGEGRDGYDEKRHGGNDVRSREDTVTVICHGHEKPSREGDLYLCGHLHPAIEIEGHRRPCFLYQSGSKPKGSVLVVPAFNRLAPGIRLDGRADPGVSLPLLNNLDRTRPIVFDPGRSEPLVFPPLGKLRTFL